MKLTTIYTFALLTFLFISCNDSNSSDYWSISKFNMDGTALKDNEEVKIIYLSHGPGSNQDLEYYNHLIIISQKTGNTVNVLTTADNGLTDQDKDSVFNFFNEDNIASKIMQMDPDDIGDIKNVDDINKIELKKIDKVSQGY